VLGLGALGGRRVQLLLDGPVAQGPQLAVAAPRVGVEHQAGEAAQRLHSVQGQRRQPVLGQDELCEGGHVVEGGLADVLQPALGKVHALEERQVVEQAVRNGADLVVAEVDH